MRELEERILSQGRTAPGGVIRVDAFLNHQIDPQLAQMIGQEFARRFASEHVTKVLTIEASGIAFAVFAAQALHVPLVFAKKGRSRSQGQDGLYTADVRSFTRGTEQLISVSRQYLTADDRVLIIDDFLAMGEAVRGLMAIVDQSGARLCGVGIVIEKGFQPGGAELRARGVRLESLVIVDRIGEDGQIVLRKDN